MMRTGALIAAALLALVLCSCSGEKSQQEDKKLSNVKGELAEVKDIADDLKAEVSAVKDETQALMQDELQEQAAAAETALQDELQEQAAAAETALQDKLQEQAAAAAETTLQKMPAIPDHPVAAPDHPAGN